MKKVIASAVALFALVSCSNNIPEPETPDPKSETTETPNPETPEVVLNTGRMLSMAGPNYSFDYEYDDKGRIIKAVYFEFGTEYNTEYKYDNDRIYVSHIQYRLLSDGGYNPNADDTILHEDTLFLVNGRVDSCIVSAQTNYRLYMKWEPQHAFYKFRYNERGEMIYEKKDVVIPRYYHNPFTKEPKYECHYEESFFEWKDGNIINITGSKSNSTEKGYVSYKYSQLTGNIVFVEPRNYLADFVALIANGYYGVACKNLVESVEYNDGFILKYAYELDEHQKVKTLKEIHTYDEEHSYTLEYNIKWDNTQY